MIRLNIQKIYYLLIKAKKNKEKKVENISFENWKFLCDNIYDKTKNTLEKCKEIINNQLIKNKDLILV